VQLGTQGWVVLPAEDGRRIGAGHRDALCDRRPGRRAGRGGAATVQGAGAGGRLHRAALGELAGLRVKRVDLLHRRITVAEQLTETRGAFAVAPPKTAAGLRTVTLPQVAATALAEHLASYAEPGPDGLVFPAARRGPLRRSNFTRRVWDPATRVVGVQGLRFHDLRHTAATLAIAAGLDELVQAASALAQQESAGRSGTRVARGGPKGSEGRGR
jgi:integrase